MARYVIAQHIAHKYGTSVETVRRWNRQGLLPTPAVVWVGKGSPHSWDKDAFLDWEPPYRGCRKHARIWERRTWNDGTDPEHGSPSEDILEPGTPDTSECAPSEDSAPLTPSEAARRLATLHGVTERTARSWLTRHIDLLQARHDCSLGITPASLGTIQPPPRGRPSRKRPQAPRSRQNGIPRVP